MTPGSSANLTNKTGLISMFTNDMNYINAANQPLSVTNNRISIAQSGPATNGYLTSSDWNNFNNKISSQWSNSAYGIFYNSGNIGIGTNAPLSLLELAGNKDDDQRYMFKIRNTSTNNKSHAAILINSGNDLSGTMMGYASESYSAVGGIGGYAFISGSGNGLLLSATKSATDGAGPGVIKFVSGIVNQEYVERMRIDVSGNVGIGTTSPKAKVEIADGDIYISNIVNGIIMLSPNGQCWKGTLDNSGLLNFVQITCP